MIGSFITTTCLLMHHISCRDFWQNIKSPRWLSPKYSPDLAPCNFWVFPKLKSALIGKRFQTVNEIQENTTGQLMLIGRTVWGPKVPTLKGTEVSWSYVQCFLYLTSSLINVSIFHSTWLATFWTDLILLKWRSRQPGWRPGSCCVTLCKQGNISGPSIYIDFKKL